MFDVVSVRVLFGSNMSWQPMRCHVHSLPVISRRYNPAALSLVLLFTQSVQLLFCSGPRALGSKWCVIDVFVSPGLLTVTWSLHCNTSCGFCNDLHLLKNRGFISAVWAILTCGYMFYLWRCRSDTCVWAENNRREIMSVTRNQVNCPGPVLAWTIEVNLLSS